MKKSLITLLFVALSLSAWAKKEKVSPAQQKVLDSAGVTVADVDQTMKELLDESADESVDDLAKQDIVKSNSLFGLDIPQIFKELASELKKLGESDELKELEESINKVGSAIIKEAGYIIGTSIQGVDFDNSVDILAGGQNAATEYLEGQSGDQIREALRPFIEKQLTGSGALDKWNAIVAKYTAATGKPVNINLVDYLTNDIVGDIFNKMGKEEAKIRFNAYFWGTVTMRAVMALQGRIPR